MLVESYPYSIFFGQRATCAATTSCYNSRYGSTVTCPSCGHQFSPDDLLTHEIEVECAKLERIVSQSQGGRGQRTSRQRSANQRVARQSQRIHGTRAKLRKEKREIEEAKENLN